MNYTDNQLKAALAKMLPEKIETNLFPCVINWRQAVWGGKEVLDTELLYLCWLVEETLNEIKSADYAELLRPIAGNYKLLYHATWQNRTIALAKVKGIEI